MNMIESPKMTVRSRQVDAYEYLCSPTCQLSYLACALAGQDYLTSKQIKTLELMGFEVLVIEEDETNTQQEN